MKATAAALLLVFFKVQVHGCRLYCLECNPDLHRSQYYCCMEDWQAEPVVKKCSGDDWSATSSPTTTPCPTLVPAPEPNRCPEVISANCEVTKKFYPNPAKCASDKDCVAPFDTCCEDGCFPTKICKTYMGDSES